MGVIKLQPFKKTKLGLFYIGLIYEKGFIISLEDISSVEVYMDEKYEKQCKCCDSCNCGCKGCCCCAILALITSGVIFLIFSLVHLYRYFVPFAVIINTAVIPEYYSLAMFLIALFLSIWNFWSAYALTRHCCKECKCDCHANASIKH